ncbi:MAG: DNA-3-methyladenine glycosylase [Fimbriimonadaceae bacterium]
MTQRQLRQLLTNNPVESAAPYLLGAIIKTSIGSCQIVEVEAYSGSLDPGSHAYRGQTPRTKVMFGQAGHIYTYFTYGNHWMLNLTAHPEDIAGAILIRAAIPLNNFETLFKNRPKAKSPKDLLSGPGKLCAAYHINSDHYGIDALTTNPILEIIPAKNPKPYVQSTRIGLASEKGDDYPWRFIDAENIEWASNPKTHLKQLNPQTPPPILQ